MEYDNVFGKVNRKAYRIVGRPESSVTREHMRRHLVDERAAGFGSSDNRVLNSLYASNCGGVDSTIPAEEFMAMGYIHRTYEKGERVRIRVVREILGGKKIPGPILGLVRKMNQNPVRVL